MRQVTGSHGAKAADEVLVDILEDEGNNVLLDAEASALEARESGAIRVMGGGGQETEVSEGSHLLVATGRRPNTDRLNTRDVR